MAAITALSQDFEGTDGATISSPATIGAAAITGGASPTFSAADVQQGNTALRVSTTANQCNVRYDFTAVQNAWFGVYFKTPSTAPAAATTLMSWYGNSNANQVGNLRINADMTFTIRDNNTAVFTTATPLPVNTWIRIAVRAQPANTTLGITGIHRFRLYVGANRHGLTPDFDSGNVSADNNVAATNVDTLHIGLISPNATSVFLFDRMRGDNASEPAGLPTSGPPIVDAGPDLTKETNSGSFTITGSNVAQGGATISSRSWQVLSGITPTMTGTTTATVTVTAPATTGTTVLRFTATDNTGLSASDDVTLTWVAPGQTFYPVADVAVGGWTTQNGATTNLFGSIDDVVYDASDYILSPQLSGSAVSYRTRLQSKPAPTNTSGWYLKLNKRDLPDNITSSLIVRLYEADGTTLRKTWTAITTQNSVDTEYQLTLTSAEVAAITTWASGLIVELSVTGS